MVVIGVLIDNPHPVSGGVEDAAGDALLNIIGGIACLTLSGALDPPLRREHDWLRGRPRRMIGWASVLVLGPLLARLFSRDAFKRSFSPVFGPDTAPSEEELSVSSVILATGWRPYPIEKLPELGGGRFPDVIANVQMERLASPWGPTGGKIVRPSDGEAPKRIAFVQCAGSRDAEHLPYCSSICCGSKCT